MSEETAKDKWKKLQPDMSEFPKLYTELFENVYCGYHCEAGWYPLLHTLCKLLQHHNKQKGLQIRIAQIKEKFGGVRFYVDGEDDYASGLIRMAEAISSLICEGCGTTIDVECKGIRGEGSWLKTLCGACRTKRQVDK